MEIEFEVDGAAITSNHAYGRNGNRTFMKREGREWKDTIGWAAIEAKKNWESQTGQVWDMRCEFSVELRFYWLDKRRRDVANLEKLAHDALQKILYNNDSQLQQHHTYRFKGDPRMDVIVKKVKLYEK